MSFKPNLLAAMPVLKGSVGMRVGIGALMALALLVAQKYRVEAATAHATYQRWEDVFVSAKRPTYLWDAGTMVADSYYSMAKQVILTASVLNRHSLAPELGAELSGKTAILIGAAYPRSTGCAPGDMAFPGGLSVIRLVTDSGAEYPPMGHKSYEALTAAFRSARGLFPLAFASGFAGITEQPTFWPAGDTGPVLECGRQVLGLALFETEETPRELQVAPTGRPSAMVRFGGPKVRLMQETEVSRYVKTVDARLRYRNEAGSPRVEACFRFKNLLPSNSIIGLRFRGMFLDAFGDLVYEELFQFDGRIEPGGTTPPDYCWYWESHSQAFGTLRSVAMAGTGSVQARVYGVALGTGIVVFFL